MPRHSQRWRILPHKPEKNFRGYWTCDWTQLYLINIFYVKQTHHSLIWIINAVGYVQKLRVLQLFTESLQQWQRLIEGDWHGDSGQVLANVVVQNGHDANVAVVCSRGREGNATAWNRATQIRTIKKIIPKGSSNRLKTVKQNGI